jgi:catechol 2,3-dioxygenase-like lactoylglutathione lyase family enzyme
MPGEFRAVWFARDYDAAVAFYRDGLELPIVGGWNRGPDDKGTLFGAASGIVEVIALHEGQRYEAPTGIGLLVEVDDVHAIYERFAAKGLTRDPPETKPWGHRQFTVTDPDGIHVTLFSQ